MSKFVTAVAWMWLLWVAGAHAQSTQGLISGRIVDSQSGRPVAGNARWTRIARDWRASTLASFRTGFPYTVYSAFQIVGVANRRPNLVKPDAIYQRTEVSGGASLLNSAAFAEPAAGNGNLGLNSLGGPGLFNIDVSLDRAIPLSGSARPGACTSARTPSTSSTTRTWAIRTRS
jgi:hypothetical protein